MNYTILSLLLALVFVGVWRLSTEPNPRTKRSQESADGLAEVSPRGYSNPSNYGSQYVRNANVQMEIQAINIRIKELYEKMYEAAQAEGVRQPGRVSSRPASVQRYQRELQELTAKRSRLESSLRYR